MALLDSAILMLCATTQAQYNAPCKASIEAGTKQYGIYDQINTGERVFDKMAERNAREGLGDTTIYVIGGGAYIYKVVQNKGVDFNLPTLGLCNSVSSHIGIETYSLRLGWNF